MKIGLALPLAALGWAAGCSSDGVNEGAGGAVATASASGSNASGVGGSAQATTTTNGSGGSTSSGNIPLNGCHSPPPSGAEMPPPPPAYSGGTCPALVDGLNTITSDGTQREFLLVLPDDVVDAETLPVVFLWHWLGGDAAGFLERAAVEEAVNVYRFAAVIPESKDDVQFKWPFSIIDSQSRVEEELTFFDDMLACVAEQQPVNLGCVSSVGVSAGALFTAAVLAGGRGEYLSSLLSLSGGTGGNFIKPWQGSAHKMPALVLWGGPSDNCFGLMDFEQTSQDLEEGLTSDGHFFLECIHNCGHSQPPLEMEGASTTFATLWEFVLDHPYWLRDGGSPYLDGGLPPSMPDWCAVGMNSATPRTGECLERPGC